MEAKPRFQRLRVANVEAKSFHKTKCSTIGWQRSIQKKLHRDLWTQTNFYICGRRTCSSYVKWFLFLAIDMTAHLPKFKCKAFWSHHSLSLLIAFWSSAALRLPCGTPDVAWKSSEELSPCLTNWVRFDKYDSIQLIKFTGLLNECNFVMLQSIECLAVLCVNLSTRIYALIYVINEFGYKTQFGFAFL